MTGQMDVLFHLDDTILAALAGFTEILRFLVLQTLVQELLKCVYCVIHLLHKTDGYILKATIHYTTVAQIFNPQFAVWRSQVSKSHCQSVDFGQLELTDFTENYVVYNGHILRFIFYFNFFFASNHDFIHLENMFDIFSRF